MGYTAVYRAFVHSFDPQKAFNKINAVIVYFVVASLKTFTYIPLLAEGNILKRASRVSVEAFNFGRKSLTYFLLFDIVNMGRETQAAFDCALMW